MRDRRYGPILIVRIECGYGCCGWAAVFAPQREQAALPAYTDPSTRYVRYTIRERAVVDLTSRSFRCGGGRDGNARKSFLEKLITYDCDKMLYCGIFWYLKIRIHQVDILRNHLRILLVVNSIKMFCIFINYVALQSKREGAKNERKEEAKELQSLQSDNLLTLFKDIDIDIADSTSA